MNWTPRTSQPNCLPSMWIQLGTRVQGKSKRTSFQPFMPGFVLLNVFLDFPHEHAIIVFQTHGRRLHNKGFWQFTSGIVRDGNDCYVTNSRVFQKVSFELSRRNLKALGEGFSLFLDHFISQASYLDFDQLLDSIHDEDMFIPLGTLPHHCFVSRFHPPILKCFCVCLRIVEVS